MSFQYAFSSADASSLRLRSTPDVKNDLKAVKKGVLVKNGKVTFCELGLFTNVLAIVSADCLDYTNNQKLDTSSDYAVYVDDGIDGKFDKLSVGNITVHPKFNSTTKANNIAVVQFEGMGINWYNAIGITRETYWGDMVYSRSNITDLDSMTWEDPVYSYNPQSGDSICDSMSGLYNANSYDFTCIEDTAVSPGSELTPCNTPYGTAYTYINSTLYLVGFYSYSSVTGDAGDDGLCNVKTVRNYYTMLSDWIVSATIQQQNATFYWYPMTVDSLPVYAPNYTLKDPGTPDPKTISLIGGDFYKDQGTFTSTSAALTASASDSNSSDNDSSQSGEDGSGLETGESSSADGSSDSISDANDTNSSRSSSQKRAIIIGVIFAFVGGVLIAVGLFYLFRQWNKTRKLSIEDPVVRATMEHMEESETNSRNDFNQIQNQAAFDVLLYTQQAEQPPVYDDDVPMRNHSVKGKSTDKK
ncbi:hypothetical protein LPJ74_006250 [Coemansia sp. RSA 1843]|nr:hypothetical protein LPJ74_006250 [Coemansia sp. RSA 1843]